MKMFVQQSYMCWIKKMIYQVCTEWRPGDAAWVAGGVQVYHRFIAPDDLQPQHRHVHTECQPPLTPSS